MNLINLVITVLQGIGTVWSILTSSILGIYGMVIFKSHAKKYCNSSVYSKVAALFSFEIIAICFSLLRLAVLIWESKRNRISQIKSTAKSQFFSVIVRGVKAVLTDLPKFIILIVLTVNKSQESVCQLNQTQYVNRYVKVYWAFFAINLALAVLLLLTAAFVRLVIRDYEAEEDDVDSSKPTSVAEVRRKSQEERDRKRKKKSILGFVKSRHHTQPAAASSPIDGPTVVTDMDLDELSFANMKNKKSTDVPDTITDISLAISPS